MIKAILSQILRTPIHSTTSLRRRTQTAPIDLLRLLLDVNAQLVAVLLLDLLISELFGLVHRAIELYNQALSPTLRQLALYGPLVVDKSLVLVGCPLCGIRFPRC